MKPEHLKEMLGYQAEDYIKVYDDFLDPETCKHLIDRFVQNPQDQRESSDDAAREAGNREYREGKLIRVSKTPGWQASDGILYQAVSKVIRRYLADHNIEVGPMGDTGYTIAHFRPGDKTHYHADTMPAGRPLRCFSLVAYLNDIDDGGETVFPHQRRWVKPKAGRVAIFPSMYTHRHYANPSNQDRFIVVTFFEVQLPAR